MSETDRDDAIDDGKNGIEIPKLKSTLNVKSIERKDGEIFS